MQAVHAKRRLDGHGGNRVAPAGRIARTEYLCSTNWAKTCREAIARFHEINAADAIIGKNIVPLNTEIKAQFA